MSATRAYSIPVTVEFEDVDGYRIAHHSRLIAFLERARVHLLADLGVDLHETMVVLHELRVRFRKPARLLDRLDVSVAVETVDDLRVVLDQRIRKGAETIVFATCSLAFVDPVEGSVVGTPDGFRQALTSLPKSAGR